jgi:hypothetical protein
MHACIELNSCALGLLQISYYWTNSFALGSGVHVDLHSFSTGVQCMLTLSWTAVQQVFARSSHCYIDSSVVAMYQVFVKIYTPIRHVLNEYLYQVEWMCTRSSTDLHITACIFLLLRSTGCSCRSTLPFDIHGCSMHVYIEFPRCAICLRQTFILLEVYIYIYMSKQCTRCSCTSTQLFDICSMHASI